MGRILLKLVAFQHFLSMSFSLEEQTLKLLFRIINLTRKVNPLTLRPLIHSAVQQEHLQFLALK